MASVFISYTHRVPDESVAQELAAALAQKHKVFIDTNIPGGRTWGEVIDQELQSADFLVPLLSAQSVASDMVVSEIEIAHSLNVKNGRPGIIPIRLDDTQFKYPLRAYVSRFQEISWTRPSDTKKLKRETLRALEQRFEQKSGTFDQPPERQVMIKRVRADWIDGILRKSLRGVPPINPALQPEPGAIEHRLDAIIQRPQEEPLPLAPGTPPSSVFDDYLGQLLILGAPGSGKTTLLLELADELLKRAEEQFNQPIPVVFNLSSWVQRRLPLEEWLIEELQLRSDVPPRISRKWVKQEQLSLLLDGLDEVASEHRAACVGAINRYRAEHGFVKMVVCSRVDEYNELTQKLRLPAAILILPLTRDQALKYLQDAGASIGSDDFNQAAQSDPGLWAFLETPLTLSIVAVVGPQLFSVQPGSGETVEKEKLFAYYTDAMFKRKAKEWRYTPDQIRHWLSWLASALSRRQQTLFRIEELRFRWLDTWYERSAVVAAIAVTVGLGSVLLGDIFMTAFVRGAFHIKAVGETLYLVSQWFSPYFFAIGVVLALLRGRVRKPVVVLQVRWPGLGRVLIAAVEGLVLGGFLGFACSYVGCALEAKRHQSGGISPQQYFIMGAVAFGCGFIMNSLARPRELEVHPSADFALKQSLRYTLTYMAVSLGLGIVGVVLLVALGFSNASDTLSTSAALVGSLGFLGWVGFFFGMEKGGYFLLDHYFTRILLFRRNRMPWDYLRFLETACERVFLRRVGSGYIFVHRMLLEYFAAKWNNESSAEKSSSPQSTGSARAAANPF